MNDLILILGGLVLLPLVGRIRSFIADFLDDTLSYKGIDKPNVPPK